MRLTGVHLLLTYQCNFECDHCFVWSGPNQLGTMSLARIRKILRQSKKLGTVEWIYFEGGEPFLYYAVLRRGVRMAARMGFKVGIVSNSYWATDAADAVECLKPFSGRVEDLSVSSDRYHSQESMSPEVKNACAAARELGIPIEVISIAQPEANDAAAAVGQLPAGESTVMYRGRAAVKLSGRAAKKPWMEFTVCPYEDLRNPERVHVDPFGHVHICQGISLGNLFRTPLEKICSRYDPDRHPITGPLLEGGPAALVRRHEVEHQDAYADACHLCYEVRCSLRGRFPEILAPDAMYGGARPGECARASPL